VGAGEEYSHPRSHIHQTHDVDMGAVLVPHFGVHLDAEEFRFLKGKLEQDWKNVKFVDEPYVRFKGNVLEQETMFIKDPSGNIIELKTMVNPDALFGEE
jgi:extradiol dioxygenase family protein